MTAKNHTEKCGAILDAACRRFGHYGYAKVTMEEIAADVNLGKASIYYYFPTKESVFEAVISREHARFVARIEETLRTPEPASQKLRVYVEERLRYFQVLVDLGATSLASSTVVNPLFTPLFRRLTREELRLLQKIFEDGKASGEFDRSLNGQVPRLFQSILQGLRLRELRTMQAGTQEMRAHQQLRQDMMAVTDLLLRAVCKKKPQHTV